MEQTQKLNLNGFSGTQEYHAGYLGVNLTDGSYFIGCNGASWLITDMCSILKIEPKVKVEEFISIKFKVIGKTAEVTYTDGNNKKLYTQTYKYTDFNKHFIETEIQFFYTNNVLMLSQEY